MPHFSHQESLSILGQFALGNVSSNFRGTNDLAVEVFHRRNSDGHMDEPSILALPDGVERGNTFPSSEPLNYLSFFFISIQWHQKCDRSADGLLSRVTENALSASIPTRDNAVQSFAENRVIRRFDNKGKSLRCSGCLLKLLLDDVTSL